LAEDAKDDSKVEPCNIDGFLVFDALSEPRLIEDLNRLKRFLRYLVRLNELLNLFQCLLVRALLLDDNFKTFADLRS